MEALDTNILVRIATRDDEAQLRKAEKLMRGNFSAKHPAWVSIVVLAELAGVLTRCYGYQRPDVGAFLHQLLHTASICVEDQAVAGKAIDLFLNSTPISPTVSSSPGTNPAPSHPPIPWIAKPRNSKVSSFFEATHGLG